MSQAVDQLLQAALALSEGEQVQLAATLLVAVDERGLRPFDEEWAAEVRRRSAEFDTGTLPTYSWAEVKEQARRRLAAND